MSYWSAQALKYVCKFLFCENLLSHFILIIFPYVNLLTVCCVFFLLQVISGSVCSKEDHGYMVDIGIGKVRAFLGWKEARRYITERNLGERLCLCDSLFDNVD